MRLADTKTTAKALVVSVSKLQNDRSLGKSFPHYKIDGRVWYDLDEVEAIIRKHRV